MQRCENIRKLNKLNTLRDYKGKTKQAGPLRCLSSYRHLSHKADDLRSKPATHVKVEGELTLQSYPLASTGMYSTHAHTHSIYIPTCNDDK